MSGRWPTRDPIGEVGGYNLYSFVRNNPISRIDPLGTKVYSFPKTAYSGGLQAGDIIQVGCYNSNGNEVIMGTIKIEEYHPVYQSKVLHIPTNSWVSKAGGGVRINALFKEEDIPCCCPTKWCLGKFLTKDACCCPEETCGCPDKSYRWVSFTTIDDTPTKAGGYYDGGGEQFLYHFLGKTKTKPEVGSYYYPKEIIEKGFIHYDFLKETIWYYWTEGGLVRFRFFDIPFNPVDLLQFTDFTKVRFQTSLVCASTGRTLAWFTWGFEYDAAGVRLY